MESLWDDNRLLQIQSATADTSTGTGRQLEGNSWTHLDAPQAYETLDKKTAKEPTLAVNEFKSAALDRKGAMRQDPRSRGRRAWVGMPKSQS
jgi:hypothetical protein